MTTLREYQKNLKSGAFNSWQNGNSNILLVSPTGSGKTVTMASMAFDLTQSGVIVAHRVELVSQISQALARFGIHHNIIGPRTTISHCIREHISELGRKYHQPSGRVTVAAVDTLNSRAKTLTQWCAQQKWWMIDEAHHVREENKWGKAVTLFPRAVGLGVTATPVRADRKSLHHAQGGVFHDMIVGPTMRDLINEGHLCDYEIYVPPVSFTMDKDDIGSTGDYKSTTLRAKSHKSQIVGDVVKSYLKFAAGKRGITFTVDVEQAEQIAQKFNDAGVPAMAVSAKTNDGVRADAIRRFREGKLLQLVNVDLFGEGFDVPAVEVVSMARPTMSYGLYVQQFGRALRVLRGKSCGIIIDHVGNVKLHGLPDAPRPWTLWQPENRRSVNEGLRVTPVRDCLNCFRAYLATKSSCPHCGFEPEPAGRSLPEEVDGDLVKLDPDVLAKMRGESDRIMGDPQIPHGASKIVEMSVKKNWNARREAQEELRRRMEVWGGWRKDKGETLSEMQRLFYFRFGIDVMSAQGLNASDAEALSEKVAVDWQNDID